MRGFALGFGSWDYASDFFWSIDECPFYFKKKNLVVMFVSAGELPKWIYRITIRIFGFPRIDKSTNSRLPRLPA